MSEPVSRRHSIDPHFAALTLADKYRLDCERIFISGAQAVVRLLLLQKEMDRQANLNTAGFVSGYRGSPLGGLDKQIFAARELLTDNNIVFQPGLNEDLAATAVWGSQQAEMRGEGRYDGVFSLWYGKGPGVDRSGDVFRHANLAGSSRHGGVIALMGDDHTAESSTTAHQSEFHFVDVMIPILNPAGVQEILDYGLYGWALSRFAGVWVGLKCVKDTIESTASVYGLPGRVAPITPADFVMPQGGLNIRPRDPVLDQEARLQDFKRDAVTAWLRANGLNKVIMSGGSHARVGVITVGKSYLDVRQALDDLGIDEVRANTIGLRLYKVACPWPIEVRGLMDFVRGLDLVIVVEEKRSLIEVQLREELYGTRNQPICVGKKDERGSWLFPVKGALDSNDIAIAIGRRLLQFHDSEELEARVDFLERAQLSLAQAQEAAIRTPYFCSGCPHNSSTKVPEGMRAYAGIGCHYMAQWMDRSTDGFTQMGGEGANWIGEAPFSTRPHVFQNLGDGTYNHSGILALRWAVAAGVNITYKILFNDAVAMTGGQAHEGGLTVDAIARQVAAEGVSRIVLITDEPNKYPATVRWPNGLKILHRRELDHAQRELAAVGGVSVLLYDQTCAAEKRRKRKRGAFPDPDMRVMINELVCEGCGDCGMVSNCMSIQPLNTEFGRKRRIDQTSCNKDFSCVDGFCPSFVTVRGARPRKLAAGSIETNGPELPDPAIPIIRDDHPYEILVTGVGGSGVVTLGAVLGMAAHLEGKGCGLIDMAGLAQKGGAVYCHIKLANKPEDIHAIRVAAGEADLVLGGDLVVTGTRRVLAAVRRDDTAVVVNSSEIYPGDFTRDPGFEIPAARIKSLIQHTAGSRVHFLDATAAARNVFGLATQANFIMLGFAWQKGLVPLSAGALLRAIALNGEATKENTDAFIWGRRLAQDSKILDSVSRAEAHTSDVRQISSSIDEAIARRKAFLAEYQDPYYAASYTRFVQTVRETDSAFARGTELSEAVAQSLFKLMAIKDEYEVARLYSNGDFIKQATALFDGELAFEFHLAPPFFAKRDPHSGRPIKMRFGGWVMNVFSVLARLRRIRGTCFDPFGYLKERRAERALIDEYRGIISELLPHLTEDNYEAALALARVPLDIKGFGYIKERTIAKARQQYSEILPKFYARQASLRAAAE